MSATHASHTDEDTRRRDTRDRDLVAILAMVAILALTAVCFVAQSALPL